MYQVSEIKILHIELTDKCQAQCPMCARNINGSGLRDFIQLKDVSLEKFKEWFPVDFIQQLDCFYSCGNYGDPAFAQDCLDIYSYVRQHNPAAKLGIHTNGGMRNKSWWKDLANVIGNVNGSYCTFGIDGFKGKHELYRRNTNFDKVIENLEAYVSQDARTIVDTLVFKHNQDEVKDLEKFLLKKGVESVNFVVTSRFYNTSTFPVFNNKNKLEYNLEPSDRPIFNKDVNYNLESLLDENNRNQVVRQSKIRPKCLNYSEIYVDISGNIYPCCLIGHDYMEDNLDESSIINILHNISINHTKQVLKKIGIPNCDDKVLHNNNILYKDFDKTWHNEDKCLTCVNACSTTIHNETKNVKS